MRQVISVSLNGRAYQLEDDAHAALAEYLDSAARSLAGNPDQAEILADLEQAIADKLERCLNPHKTVVTRSEIGQVIQEMGPVDAGAGSGAMHEGNPADAAGQGSGPAGAAAGASQTDAAAQTGAAASKRLYQISDGALISGVCKGIAVYLDIDVTLVRLLFVIAAVLTGGLAMLVYVAMMFIVPYANTPEEYAAARGLPFNARVLVEQAKLKAAHLANVATQAAMHNHSRAARAQWKAEWRKARAEWRQEWRRASLTGTHIGGRASAGRRRCNTWWRSPGAAGRSGEERFLTIYLPAYRPQNRSDRKDSAANTRLPLTASPSAFSPDRTPSATSPVARAPSHNTGAEMKQWRRPQRAALRAHPVPIHANAMAHMTAVRASGICRKFVETPRASGNTHQKMMLTG